MSENSGMKIGMGVSAAGLGLAYSYPKIIDKITGIGIKAIRNQIQSADELSVNLEKMGIPRPKKYVIQMEKENLYKKADELFKMRNKLKSTNFPKMVARFIPVYIALGAIVDFANKMQRKKAEPNAQTNKGNNYTKVNMGKKLGAGLGLIAAGIGLAINRKSYAKLFNIMPDQKIKTLVQGSIMDVVAGFGLGALADKMSNHKAAKEADKA